MRYLGAFILLISIICISNGCERDDVCSEQSDSTPLLVIRFYNKDNNLLLKKVDQLYVVGVGKNTAIISAADTDSIGIPLKIYDKESSFLLIQNYVKDGENKETDTLNISYNPIQQYLYRGCGFIANYDNIKPITKDKERWITKIEIVDTLIKSQDHAHIKIFH